MDLTLTMAAVMHELGKLLEHLLLGKHSSILLNWTPSSARWRSSSKSIQQSNASLILFSRMCLPGKDVL